MRRIALRFVFSIFLASVWSFGQPDATRVTVSPIDNGKGLLNPQMGWKFLHHHDGGAVWEPDYCSMLNALPGISKYGYRCTGKSGISDALYTQVPGANIMYFRLPWSVIEPYEGQFNWQVIDHVAKPWIESGRQIVLRFNPVDNMQATPDFVREAGAQGEISSQGYWVGNTSDPIFLAKYKALLDAVAARYVTGKTGVAHIEVGMAGRWGEGHCWEIPGIACKGMSQSITLLRQAFPNLPLMGNDDYGEPYATQARNLGFGLIDDSGGGVACPGMPGRGYGSDLFGSFWRTVECGMEFWCGWPGCGTCPGDVLASINYWHLSYVNMWTNDPAGMYQQNKATMDEIARRVGYRLQIAEASWPAAAMIGEARVVFKMKLRDAGAAPCYKGGFSAISLKASNGSIAATFVDTLFNVSSLTVGAGTNTGQPSTVGPLAAESLQVRLPGTLTAGQYQVLVSIGLKDGTPVYALPYDNSDGNRRYVLGNISITGASDNTPPTTPGNCAAQAVDDKSVRLSWNAASDPESGVYGYIVYRGGQKIAETAATPYVDNGLRERTTYTYEISATNLFAMEGPKCQSQVTTPADATRPTLVSASAMNGANSVTVVFSEPVEAQSAGQAANYSFSGGISVTGASLQADGATVILPTSAMTGDVTYTLTVNNVRDRAQTPNTIAAGSTIAFKYMAGVTKIRFFPRSGVAARMAGGVFEGTNGDKDIGPYTALYTISSTPADGQWTEVAPVNSTIGYRYVRYRAAGFCNIAEIEFYRGTQKVSGTVFGTPGSWGNSGNDFTKVFDGNTATFMDYSAETGGYTGLDLQPGAVVIGKGGVATKACGTMAVAVTGKRVIVSGIDKNATIGLYDLSGNLVRSMRNVSAGAIDLNGPHATPLAAGHYFLKISSNGRELTRGIWLLPN